MKNKRKLKIKNYWFLAPLGLVGILLPIGLSSCANISQYILPITTGSMTDGPYSGALADTDCDFFKPLSSDSTNPYDSKYSSYVPNNCITYINRSASNSVTGYGYMNPQDIKHGGSTPTNGNFNNFGYGYYGTNDKKMQYINDDDKDSIVRSYQNLNQVIATGAVSTITSTLSSLFNAMVHFVSQSGVTFSDKRGEWIDNLLNSSTPMGDTWHGSKTGSENEKVQNRKFFEFLFDTNNLLSTGNVHYRFDISSLNFHFTDNPFIDKDNCGGAADGTISSTNEKYNVYTNTLFDPNNISNINENVQAYASYADCKNNDDHGNPYHYLSDFAYSIPTIITTSHTTEPTMQYTYYDPTKNHGYIPNEYLNVDMNKVTKAINSTGAWKNIDNLIDKKHKDLNDIQQSYSLNSSSDGLAPPTGGVNDDTSYEPALNDVLDKIKDNQCRKSDFLALKNYTVLSYKLPTDDHDTSFYQDVTDKGKDEKGNDAQNVHVPLFSGIQQNLYPITLLLDKDNKFDTNLLKSQTKAIYIDPKTGKDRDKSEPDSHKLKYLDIEKLNEKFSQFMSFLTTMVTKETNPNDYKIKYPHKYIKWNKDTDFISYYSKIFKDIFGSDSSDDWISPIQ